ncbi:hypothetical protein L202_07040 [Cryptococcus amylolentus CBS 6039]|uniref:Thiamine-binding protein domain-containing protein n=2 Tax=Cryptococcus amylolentus TaxID=104669 RepID=A0A1E3HEF0_9TREE|nr:hypothetical protein L202_07040 [Cryptococcus amylolentus CBS 6039]ODN74709.1 hypothetical protein L202_07040 [Cryptococcus amylolentus CBS 6039]
MGLPTPSVGPEIAEVQRVLEKSGLEYTLNDILMRPRWDGAVLTAHSGYGTNVEGPWDAVMKTIGDCHNAVHALGTPRIATDIRIGTRTDKSISSGGNEGKKKRVEDILAAQKQKQ